MTSKLGSTTFGIVGMALMAVPSQANAQAWIGQVVGNMIAQQQAAADRAACMKGTPPADKEIAEAYGPANALMQKYYSAMQADDAARSSFFALDKKAAFIDGAAELSRDDLDEGTDSLVTAGNMISAEPYGFVRSYLYAEALGQWPVRDAAGQVVGVYNAQFVRKLGEWKLRVLTLENAANYSGPIGQFCNEPGDVLPYRITNSENRQEYFGKRLTKAEGKLVKAKEKLVKQEAGIAKKPESARAKDKYAKALEKVAKWEGEVIERQTALETANADYDAAMADQAALAEQRAAARAELGI